MVEKNEDEDWGMEDDWGLGDGLEDDVELPYYDEPELLKKASSVNEEKIYSTDKSRLPYKMISKKDILKKQNEAIEEIVD